MKLRFVNQAGFVIDHAGRSLLCDPWLHGRVFNDGWELISKTKFSSADFASIDYIWFSHEHPDHFSPPSLATIHPDVRKKITILFQLTPDKRVVTYCRNAGFKNVVELDGSPFQIAEDFSLVNVPFRAGDSWLHCRIGSLSLLNTNDCVISDAQDAARIKRRVEHVDVLLTKFSYASWTGNPEQTELRQQAATKKLTDLKLQVDFFKPAVTIPIASQIFFCHEENYYLNDHINSPRVAHDFLIQNTSSQSTVLYPGDVFEFGQAVDSRPSMSSYDRDLALALHRIKSETAFLSANVPASRQELANQADSLLSRLRSASVQSPGDGECSVYVWDHSCSYVLSRDAGLRRENLARGECDIELSSESLLFCLTYPHNADSVRLSGRMRRTNPGNYLRFLRFFGS